MSTEVKYSKFLIGLCLNSGDSLQSIAKNFGIHANREEINNFVSMLEMDGFVSKIERSTKETFAYLSPKGNDKAVSLINGDV